MMRDSKDYAKMTEDLVSIVSVIFILTAYIVFLAFPVFLAITESPWWLFTYVLHAGLFAVIRLNNRVEKRKKSGWDSNEDS